MRAVSHPHLVLSQKWLTNSVIADFDLPADVTGLMDLDELPVNTMNRDGGYKAATRR